MTLDPPLPQPAAVIGTGIFLGVLLGVFASFAIPGLLGGGGGAPANSGVPLALAIGPLAGAVLGGFAGWRAVQLLGKKSGARERNRKAKVVLAELGPDSLATDDEICEAILRERGVTTVRMDRFRLDDVDRAEQRLGRPLPRVWVANRPTQAVPAPTPQVMIHSSGKITGQPFIDNRQGAMAAAGVVGLLVEKLIRGTKSHLKRRWRGPKRWGITGDGASAMLVRLDRKGEATESRPVDPEALVIIASEDFAQKHKPNPTGSVVHRVYQRSEPRAFQAFDPPDLDALPWWPAVQIAIEEIQSRDAEVLAAAAPS